MNKKQRKIHNLRRKVRRDAAREAVAVATREQAKVIKYAMIHAITRAATHSDRPTYDRKRDVLRAFSDAIQALRSAREFLPRFADAMGSDQSTIIVLSDLDIAMSEKFSIDRFYVAQREYMDRMQGRSDQALHEDIMTTYRQFLKPRLTDPTA